VDYAESVKNPVLVLEDLTYIRESMDYGEYMNRRLHGWGFAKLHAQIRYKAVEEGYPRQDGEPSQHLEECHACGEGRIPPTTGDVQVYERCVLDGRVPSGRERAVNIADRYLSGRVVSENTRTTMTRLRMGAFDRPTRQPSRCYQARDAWNVCVLKP